MRWEEAKEEAEGLKLTCYDYLETSGARMETARRLHASSRYSAAIYFAGVAIECLLRAFITRRTSQFDERHDLLQLYNKSQLEAFIEPEHQRRAEAWLGEVWSRWKNNYRYASDGRLRSEFRRLGHNRGIKGDFLKENSRRVVESGYGLWAFGERRWHSNIS